jgi:hypothetical protein
LAVVAVVDIQLRQHSLMAQQADQAAAQLVDNLLAQAVQQLQVKALLVDQVLVLQTITAAAAAALARLETQMVSLLVAMDHLLIHLGV